jgi:two-component system, LytTR family, response regulator
MKISCIIIEDEPLATEKLENVISQVSFLDRVASFNNAIDGLHFLKQHKVDILFLDIQMEQLTGIQLLESFQIKPYVIITTAYAEFALKGYELQVFDYLLKPFSFERFLQAVNKVLDNIQSKQITKENISHIFIKTEYRLEQIAINDILFIEGMQGYLRVHLNNRKIMTKQSFKTLLDMLPHNTFIQVHKSWAVSIPKIESIERNRIKIAGKLIPIGDAFKNAFYSKTGC